MKRKPGLRRPHAFISLTLVTACLITVGFSAWLVSSDTDVTYGETDSNTMTASLSNYGTEGTLNFDTTVNTSEFENVSTANSYDNVKVEAKLTYTDNSSHPLKDNFEFFDSDNPYGGSSPTLKETNTGVEFNMENHYVSSTDSTVSSWINYQECYNAVSTSSPSDSEIEAKVNEFVYVTAPPSGYTSEYYIYPTSEVTSQSSSRYRFVATRLASSSSSGYYKNYRIHIFYYTTQNGSDVLTYYSNGTKYQTSNTTKDWPTLTVSSESLSSTTTSSSTVRFTNSNSVFSGTLSYTLRDTYWQNSSGQDPYIEVLDTSRDSSDFGDGVDTVCRDWIYDYMKTKVNTSSSYTCDKTTDIISDTDTDDDGNLILGMDTSRYPFMKTYFARLQYNSVQYRYYRVFHFVYVKGSTKLKVMHANANLGVSSGTNYSSTYPTVYINSVDESSNTSNYNRYQYGTTNTSAFRTVLTYYTKSSSTASDTSATNTSYARLLDSDVNTFILDTSVTQDDFDDYQIYDYMKNVTMPDASTYTTELIVDYDTVSQYVTGIDNYPYVKFVMGRRYYTSTSTYQNYYLYAVVKRYSSANGQLIYGYTSCNLGTSCKSSNWPTYTLYAEGSGYSSSLPSVINGETYTGDRSIIYLTRYYEATTGASTKNSNANINLAGDSNGNAETVSYDSTLESELVSAGTMTSAEYQALTYTDAEEEAETDNFEKHFSNTAYLYRSLDESKENNFRCYIQSGNYYFAWTYYTKGYMNSANSTPVVETGRQGLFLDYQDPYYDGYLYSSSGTALTTSTLDPDTYEYQGYEIVKPRQSEKLGVKFIFQNKTDSTDVKKYYIDLSDNSGSNPKTYFKTLMSGYTGSQYHFKYTLNVKAKNDTAAANMEEWLKDYNFQFTVGLNTETMQGDYYEA